MTAFQLLLPKVERKITVADGAHLELNDCEIDAQSAGLFTRPLVGSYRWLLFLPTPRFTWALCCAHSLARSLDPSFALEERLMSMNRMRRFHTVPILSGAHGGQNDYEIDA